MTKKSATKDPPFDPPQWPAAKVEMWKLDRIKHYPKNPRTHPQDQLDKLAASMRDDGVTMPILVDEAGEIIAGHGRALAAAANGFEEYPVVVARGWSEEKKRAVRLKDNAIGILSGWDNQLIVGELQDLKLSGYDMPLLGFPEHQMRGWGIALGMESAVDPEATPEPPKKAVVRRGDLWILGDHRLLCGDATSESDVAMCLGGASPHLMVTDAPYGVEYDANWRNERVRSDGSPIAGRAIGKVTNDHQADWREAWNLFQGSSAYLWSAGLRSREAIESLEAAGFIIRAQIIWAKTRFAIGRGDYHFQHEPCWYGVRKGKKSGWQGARDQATLWTINHIKSETGHSTQKPIECMKRPIENNSRAGEQVYDPFVGSGTTIIACEMTARKALAIEIDPAYCEVSIRRWESFTGKKATLDGQTLEQVAEARRKGKAKGNAIGHTRKSVPRAHSGGNGTKQTIRGNVHAGQPAARGKPAGEPPVVAGDS